jgi:hypothetical protein
MNTLFESFGNEQAAASKQAAFSGTTAPKQKTGHGEESW